MVDRTLDNWIESFENGTAHLPSPALFRKWAAISAIAGALERKVWVHTLGSNLYPALYIVLVGRPGVGKTVLSKRVHKLWKNLPEHYVASSNLTKAAMADELEAAKRSVLTGLDKVMDPTGGTFNSLLISSNELGQLIPQYTSEMMNFLTDIFDCEIYTEKRRGSKDIIHVERPFINLFACTTPSFLNEFLHEGAWDQGFMSRVIPVYSGEVTLTSLFNRPKDDPSVGKALQDDLKHIGNLYGEMKFQPEAAHEIDDWHMKGGHPRPDHPRLMHYLTRRTQHLLKLCIVASVAESDDLIITRTHFRTALRWLQEVEDAMPGIFKAMASGGAAQIIQDTWYHVSELHAENGGNGVSEADIFRYLQGRVAESWQAEPLFKSMVRAKIIVQKGQTYVPAKRA